jgi:hypothetical protein
MSSQEAAAVVDIETTLKSLEGLINAVADTNDKRYALLLQIIEDIKKRVDALESKVLEMQTDAIAKASAEIVKAVCGGGKNNE